MWCTSWGRPDSFKRRFLKWVKNGSTYLVYPLLMSFFLILGEYEILQRRVSLSLGRLFVTGGAKRVCARTPVDIGSLRITCLFSPRMDSTDDCEWPNCIFLSVTDLIICLLIPSHVAGHFTIYRAWKSSPALRGKFQGISTVSFGRYTRQSSRIQWRPPGVYWMPRASSTISWRRRF